MSCVTESSSIQPLILATSLSVTFSRPSARPLLVVLLDHPQAADGQQLLAAQVQLPRGHELFLRLELKVLGQRLAQLGRFLRRALLEDLLLVRR